MCWQGFRKRPRSAIRRPPVGRHRRYRCFGSEAKPTRRTFVTASSRRRPRACRWAGSRQCCSSAALMSPRFLPVLPSRRQELSRGPAALSCEPCAVAWRTQRTDPGGVRRPGLAPGHFSPFAARSCAPGGCSRARCRSAIPPARPCRRSRHGASGRGWYGSAGCPTACAPG
jgi:hypothetical protein